MEIQKPSRIVGAGDRGSPLGGGLKKYFGKEPVKLSRDDFVRLAQDSINKFRQAGAGENELEEMKLTVFGGPCFHCQAKFKQRFTKNILADFYDFIPTCSCFGDRERQVEGALRLTSKIEHSGIPASYRAASFENWDRTVNQTTNRAFLKVVEYANSKLWEKGRGLIMHGYGGTGKTHCAVSVLKRVFTQTDKSAYYLSMADLTSRIISGKNDEIASLRSFDVLVLDDLDKMNLGKDDRSPWIHENIFRLIDGSIASGHVIIGTSEFKNLEELSSRFPGDIVRRLVRGCEFVYFEGEDYNIKIATKRR